MRRARPLRPLALATILFGACTPNVTQEPPPPDTVVAEFDPGAAVPVVPTPTDLAINPATGKIVVPAGPNASPAQIELNQSYLGALAGFPFETPAQASFSGDLDPASVTAGSVVAADLTAGGAGVPITPTWVPGKRIVVIPPPKGGWTRAHRYAVAIVGGAAAVRGANGQTVVGSTTFALVSSPNPLVTCADLTAPDCRPTVDILPSTETDPGARLADQTKKALSLEQIRRGLSPVFDGFAAHGVPRDQIVLLWTFGILDAAEVTFDPASSVVPFPNDVLRANGKVTLPNPKTGAPLAAADCAAPTDLQIQITCGLNTLDGFSTLAPLVSESSDALGALEQGTLAPATLTPASVGLVPVSPVDPKVARTAPIYTPTATPGAAVPEQLQWRLDAPLDERTTYLAYVTTDATDSAGKPVVPTPTFALLRGASPLADGGGHSLVDALTDAQAAQLEPLRAALAPALDGLAAKGIPRTKLALAFAFTTQSEATQLDALAAYPATLPNVPTDPTFVVDETTQALAAATSQGLAVDSIAKVVAGRFVTPVALTGPGGTFALDKPVLQPVEFVAAIPSGAAPAGGFPVTIFGHAFTRDRNDVLAIGNAIAKAGRIAIAADIVFHGDRTSCTGAASVLQQPSDDAACANPTTEKCNEDPLFGRCVARTDATRQACTAGPAGDASCAAAGQGRCVAADAKCEGGDFLRDSAGRPQISGWNILDVSNVFASRDHLRQQVIDLSTLVRVLRGTGALAIGQAAGVTVDATKLDYVGQSLGGIVGALFNAAFPDTTNVALDAAGGALSQIILTAPSFAKEKAGLVATLAAAGIAVGTPAFDRFVATSQWILDPADPANVGYRLTHGPNANRHVLLQFIEGDQTVPNVASLALVRGANRTFVAMPPSFGCVAPLSCYELTEQGDAFDATTATPETRHPFLIRPPTGARGLALTAKGQIQVSTFLTTGALP